MLQLAFSKSRRGGWQNQHRHEWNKSLGPRMNQRCLMTMVAKPILRAFISRKFASIAARHDTACGAQARPFFPTCFRCYVESRHCGGEWCKRAFHPEAHAIFAAGLLFLMSFMKSMLGFSILFHIGMVVIACVWSNAQQHRESCMRKNPHAKTHRMT